MRYALNLCLVGTLIFSCSACGKKESGSTRMDAGSPKTNGNAPNATGGSGQTDANLVLGEWQAISGESRGKRMSPEKIRATNMVVTSKFWTFPDFLGDDEFAYQLDSTKDPKEVTFTRTKKAQAGSFAFYKEKMLGLYAVEGNTLKLCIAGVFEKERPKRLDGKQDWLTVFTRKN